MINVETANEGYKELLNLIKDEGVEYNIRGSKCKEVINVSYRINDIRRRIITEVNRKFPVRACIAEFLWYMTGDSRYAVIEPFLSAWKNYSDDFVNVNSNYGYQWQYPHDQIKGIIKKIKNDSHTRQAVVCLYDKSYSEYYGKDNICTPTFQLFFRDDKLHLTVNSRSRDLIRGECIDQFTFTCLQELVANELGVEPGYYQNNIGSLHIYETHYHLLDCEPVFEKVNYEEKIYPKYSNFWNYIDLYHKGIERADFICDIVKEKKIDLGHFLKYANI